MKLLHKYAVADSNGRYAKIMVIRHGMKWCEVRWDAYKFDYSTEALRQLQEELEGVNWQPCLDAAWEEIVESGAPMAKNAELIGGLGYGHMYGLTWSWAVSVAEMLYILYGFAVTNLQQRGCENP